MLLGRWTAIENKDWFQSHSSPRLYKVDEVLLVVFEAATESRRDISLAVERVDDSPGVNGECSALTLIAFLPCSEGEFFSQRALVGLYEASESLLKY